MGAAEEAVHLQQYLLASLRARKRVRLEEVQQVRMVMTLEVQLQAQVELPHPADHQKEEEQAALNMFRDRAVKSRWILHVSFLHLCHAMITEAEHQMLLMRHSSNAAQRRRRRAGRLQMGFCWS